MKEVSSWLKANVGRASKPNISKLILCLLEIFFQPNTVGINETTGNFSVTVVNNQLRIVGENNFNTVMIYDLAGKIIHHSYKLNNSSYIWNVNGSVTAGVYIAQINDGKTNYTYKFAVK